MAKIQATFDGRVVADVEARQVGTSTVYEFPVYVNHRKKNRDSGQYEDTGDTSKIRVSVWNEKPSVTKGDIVEVVASLIEKEWAKKDGSTGRMLQTEFVDSVTVKSSKGSADNLATLGARELDAPF